LLEDGLGDTIRVSLTEDPELEIPVCKDLVKRYEVRSQNPIAIGSEVRNRGSETSYFVPRTPDLRLPYDPFHYQRRETFAIDNIGGKHVPVVIADLSKIPAITPSHLQSIGYTYDQVTDKWNISDAAADYIFTGQEELGFALPGTLKVITWPDQWLEATDKTKYFPIYEVKGYTEAEAKSDAINFVMLDCFSEQTPLNGFAWLDALANDKSVVLCLSSKNPHTMAAIRRMFIELQQRKIKNPVILITDSNWQTPDEHLVHFATETGALLLDGFGDGICLGMTSPAYKSVNDQLSTVNASGRNYLNNLTTEQFMNNTAFGILQATRTRISKTEYISCPSCGRTLFDLQETTAKIRSRTSHLKGVKIAIMGCIVNGPGEMADADFGYVGSGPGKITLYKGKEVMKRNVNSKVAVDELINLLKESEVWIAPY
jgi:(E)-4-hydroxy-3-methylbut-2-enyl-diphosphate synthase